MYDLVSSAAAGRCSSSVTVCVCVLSLRATVFVSVCPSSSIGGWWITWCVPLSFFPPLQLPSSCSPQWRSQSPRPRSPSVIATWWTPLLQKCLSASSPWWRTKPYALDSTDSWKLTCGFRLQKQFFQFNVKCEKNKYLVLWLFSFMQNIHFGVKTRGFYI